MKPLTGWRTAFVALNCQASSGLVSECDSTRRWFTTDITTAKRVLMLPPPRPHSPTWFWEIPVESSCQIKCRLEESVFHTSDFHSWLCLFHGCDSQTNCFSVFSFLFFFFSFFQVDKRPNKSSKATVEIRRSWTVLWSSQNKKQTNKQSHKPENCSICSKSTSSSSSRDVTLTAV